MDANKDLNFPFYIKATILLVGLFAFVSMLYIAQEIIVPLIFSVMIAVFSIQLSTFLLG